LMLHTGRGSLELTVGNAGYCIASVKSLMPRNGLVLVNDANLKTGACCSQCGKAISQNYVRKLSNNFLCCDLKCYRRTAEKSFENCVQPANLGTQCS
jgi:hypothetical protein